MMIAPIDRRPFPLPVKPFEPNKNEVIDNATHALLDGDGNGSVTKDEWKKANWDGDRFALFDANNDGEISQIEFLQGRRYEREFNDKDHDGNGVLSRFEFQGIKHFALDHFSAVGKGLIEGTEKANDLVMRCLPPFIRDRFAMADKDGDGQVSKEEYFASRRSLLVKPLYTEGGGPINKAPEWDLRQLNPAIVK